MAEQSEKEIEEIIADRLREAGLKFVTEKAIGGRRISLFTGRMVGSLSLKPEVGIFPG